jgi:hypothetical protein
MISVPGCSVESSTSKTFQAGFPPMTAGINPMPARSDGLDIVEGSPDPGDIAAQALWGKAGIAADGPEMAF